MECSKTDTIDIRTCINFKQYLLIEIFVMESRLGIPPVVWISPEFSVILWTLFATYEIVRR